MKLNNRKFLNPHYDGTLYVAYWDVTDEKYPDATFYITDGSSTITFYVSLGKDYKQDMGMLENLKKEIEEFLEAARKARPQAVKVLAEMDMF